MKIKVLQEEPITPPVTGYELTITPDEAAMLKAVVGGTSVPDNAKLRDLVYGFWDKLVLAGVPDQFKLSVQHENILLRKHRHNEE